FLDSGRARANPELAQAAETLLALRERDPFASDGPLWYRGMVDCSPALERQRLQQALGKLGARRLVVGHTPTSNRLVQQRFDGALLLADTGMLASYYGGRAAALVFENGTVQVRYPGEQAAQAVAQPRSVGSRLLSLDDAGIATALTE